MRKRAFFNVRYKDKEGQKPDTTPLWFTDERFEVKPIDYNNNYLYTDSDVDRWNAPPPVSWQNSGKPRGLVPGDGKEVKNLVKNDSKVFDDEDDVVKSLNKQEKIIEQVKKAIITGG